MANLATASAQASYAERGDDLYETPPEAVHALLQAENLPPYIWEPACGPGAIVSVLRGVGYKVLATDLIDYRTEFQDEGGMDFLQVRGCPAHHAIVTNPPFKLANEFVAHALDICPRVYMLLRLAFLESQRRTDVLERRGLARVHVFRNRLPMMHRDGWGGPRIKTGAMAFAWFVWCREHSGPTELRRISWEPA